jgi:hypothetical protein
MSEERRGFAVSDRRHFHADGKARETDHASPQKAKRADSQAEPCATQSGTAAARATSDEPITFSQFLISIAAQAGLLLQPDTGSEDEQASHPEAARKIISILEMLQEKTEGRRTPEETGLLEKLLFELRMAYVTICAKGGS